MSTASGLNSTAIGNQSLASGVSAVAVGDGASAAGVAGVAIGHGAAANSGIAIGAAAGASNTSTAIGNGASATGSTSVALGNGALAVASDSVAIGNDSVANQADTVSVGAVGSERRVTNVDDGIAGTDAVNLNQLQASQAAAISTSEAYTDAKFHILNNAINHVQSRADAGTAAALAVGGLAQAVTPGKSMVTGGVGEWGGQTALAFGLSHRMNDGHWTIKAGATVTNYGQAGGSASVGYEF
jgi:autotransporter adhesin